MINMLLSRRCRSPRMRRGATWFLTLAVLSYAMAPTMAQSPSSKARSSDAGSQDTGKSKRAARNSGDDAPAPAPDVAPAATEDPSQTRKVEPIEVFKDPNVERLQLLDLTKFKALPSVAYSDVDLLSVKDWAGNKNAVADRPTVDRVVRGLAAKLTDKDGIQALIEMPDEEPAPSVAGPVNKAALRKAQAAADARSEAAKAIPNATSDLLEPIFRARSAGNTEFLKLYQNSLRNALPALLTNHLVPRVQAMIVLGESGSTDLVEIFEKEINNPKQSLWVKLWAIEGIKKMKEFGGRLPSDAEAKAAKVISDFLDKSQPLPWPVQLRGLEALSYLRQGFEPTKPKQAYMASTAMKFLADREARLEVRAEAARALGLMQINSAVEKYNFPLAAYEAGELAAELASRLDNLYPSDGKPVQNRTKANYLTALLIGPVYQAFDGISTQRDSGGLLRTAPSTSLDYVQKIFGLVKPIAQSCVDLLGSPPKQYKDRKKALASQIAALRTHLQKNPPASRKLVPSGEEFVAAGDEAANPIADPPAKPALGRGRGR